MRNCFAEICKNGLAWRALIRWNVHLWIRSSFGKGLNFIVIWAWSDYPGASPETGCQRTARGRYDRACDKGAGSR